MTDNQTRIGYYLRSGAQNAIDQIDSALEHAADDTYIPSAKITSAEGYLRAARMILIQATQTLGPGDES